MIEIERRFLVPIDAALTHSASASPAVIEQAYLTNSGKWQVRSRKVTESALTRYLLTMKRRTSIGEAIELESASSKEMHDQVVAVTGVVLKKVRTHHPLASGQTLELDIFEDDSLVPGQAIAEVEVASLGEHIALPAWVGPEITGQSRYSNAKLFKALLERD